MKVMKMTKMSKVMMKREMTTTIMILNLVMNTLAYNVCMTKHFWKLR